MNYVTMFIHECITIATKTRVVLGTIPYSGKLSREKTFANFEVQEPSAKVFSMKFWGMPHPLMFGFKLSMKVFSVKFSLPTDPRNFSPSKVYRYTVFSYANFD